MWSWRQRGVEKITGAQRFTDRLNVFQRHGMVTFPVARGWTTQSVGCCDLRKVKMPHSSSRRSPDRIWCQARPVSFHSLCFFRSDACTARCLAKVPSSVGASAISYNSDWLLALNEISRLASPMDWIFPKYPDNGGAGPIEGLGEWPYRSRKEKRRRVEAVRLCSWPLTLIRDELIGVIDGQKRRV